MQEAGCESLRPLPFKSPRGTDNRKGEERTRPATPPSTLPAHPRPGRNDVQGPCAPGLIAPPPRSPRPRTLPVSPGKRLDQAVGCHCACAERGVRSAPSVGSEEGLFPSPRFRLLPLFSPGGEPGRRGGRGRDAWLPPCWADT